MSKKQNKYSFQVYTAGSNGSIQLAIGDNNGGYRIDGPKFSGNSKLLSTHFITTRDIEEIRRYLDSAEKLIAAQP